MVFGSLTFKLVTEAEVPFPGAVPESIYSFIGESLKYCKAGETSSNASGLVKYAVRIRNRTDSSLYVFDTLENAGAYARTGDEATCLAYVAAGPVVSPVGAGFIQIFSPPLYSNSLN